MVKEKKKNKWIWPTIIIGIFLLFWLFSGSEDYSDIEKNSDYKNIKEEIKKSIVWVKYEVTGKNSDGSYFENGITGSGVIVRNKNNELTIYTNRHVVDCEFNDINCFQRISENIQVRTQDGKIHQVDEVSFSESNIDLAILKIKTSNSLNYPFAYYTDEFDINEKVIAVGYPSYAENVVEFSMSEGRITNIKEVLSQSTGTSFRYIESDVYTYFGSSGGGLFDAYGNLIGINTLIWTDEFGSVKVSGAIDFSSIGEDKFIYCPDDSYFVDGNCYKFCEREQIMGKNRGCYDVCEGFYCNSQIPQVNDPNCDSGYILGSDGYCHLSCGSTIEYCPGSDSICLNNKCYSQCSQGYLWEDGICRVYE
tara:strand:+ start:158 stop:1249 length:1092 start_codon:yes stop_codon:yes gene_type:complete